MGVIKDDVGERLERVAQLLAEAQGEIEELRSRTGAVAPESTSAAARRRATEAQRDANAAHERAVTISDSSSKRSRRRRRQE
jgi:predicted component of type VI protein secretion system